MRALTLGDIIFFLVYVKVHADCKKKNGMTDFENTLYLNRNSKNIVPKHFSVLFCLSFTLVFIFFVLFYSFRICRAFDLVS